MSLRPLSIALRAVVILVASGALLILAASTALADNGPHVMGTSGGTGASAISTADGCAGCHRAHTAQGSSLLVAGNDVNLCFSCHGSGAQGATTNVVDGIIANSTNGIMGGGFTNARMDSSWNAVSPSRSVTSAHVYNGGTGTLWGAGPISGTSNAGQTGFTLSCVSCHNPHGNGQYRILRPIPMNAPATTGITVPDPTVKVYTLATSFNRYFGQIYSADVEVTLDQWCSSCHSRYDAPGPNSANTSSGDAIFKYRHGTRRVASDATSCDSCHPGSPGNWGPTNNALGITSGTAHVPVCQNCHVAHGSPAVMGTQSGAVPYPDGTTAATDNARSSLLRVDNRGVCRGCHGR